MSTDSRLTRMAGSGRHPSLGRQAAALLVALAIPFAAAAVGGWATSRTVDTWYPTLDKPSWTPPGQVIGAIWTVLYTIVGIGAWLVWRQGARGADPALVARAQQLFALQLALNVGWSLAFFGLRSVVGGLFVIVPLWVAIFAWARASARVSPAAGWLQIPYLVWVAFAAFLNATIWWRN